jgi:hypothetical protein
MQLLYVLKLLRCRCWDDCPHDRTGVNTLPSIGHIDACFDGSSDLLGSSYFGRC